MSENKNNNAREKITRKEYEERHTLTLVEITTLQGKIKHFNLILLL